MTSWEDEPLPFDELSPVSLREDIETLSAVLHGLTPRVGGMDSRLAQAETTVMRADGRVLEVEKTLRAVSAQVKRLSARVDWLERNIRLSGGAEVQLDDVPPDLVRLARTAEEGREESARLLVDADRARLEGMVHAHGVAVQDLVRLRRSGLAECEVLASTGPQDPEHRAAAGRFGGLMARYEDVRAEAARLAGPAVAAAEELREDDGRRLDGAGAVADGEQAWTTLLAQLRTRLADAVGEGALLPEWFVGVLGPIPAPADTAAWMDAGTELLAYRVTYGVADPVRALGPAPERGTPRAAWHRTLDDRLQTHA